MKIRLECETQNEADEFEEVIKAMYTVVSRSAWDKYPNKDSIMQRTYIDFREKKADE